MCAASVIDLYMFTKEELLKWGQTEQPLMELDWDSEVYLQWDGCPQGLTPAAPAFNIHLVHGFNTTLRELWRKLWILYTDDLLLMGEPEEHVVVIQRICSLVLEKLGKKVISQCVRSVKKWRACRALVHETWSATE